MAREVNNSIVGNLAARDGFAIGREINGFEALIFRHQVYDGIRFSPAERQPLKVLETRLPTRSIVARCFNSYAC